MAKMATVVQSNVTLRLRDINAAVLSYSCSKRYMENAVPLYIINILYNRLELPEDEFEEQDFGDTKFVIFKMTAKNDVFNRFNGWMKGFKDAIGKDLLKDFMIVINDSTGALKEYYKFTFSYSKNAEEKEDAKFLRETTFKMFDNIKLLGQFPKWEYGEHTLIAQIGYVRDAPASYQAPYFVHDIASEHSVRRGIKKLDAIKKPFCFNKITTGHHAFACRYNSEKFTIPNDESDDGSLLTLSDDDEELKHKQELDSKAPSSPVISIKSFSNSDVQEQPLCICGSDFHHSDITLENCSGCANKYHRPCFGYLLTPIPNFRCLNCKGTANIPRYLRGSEITVYRTRLILAFYYLTGEPPLQLVQSFPSQDREVIENFLQIKVAITLRNDKRSLPPEWNKKVEKIMENVFVDYPELEHHERSLSVRINEMLSY